MKERLNLRRSIYVEMVVLLLVSLGISLAFFGLVHLACESMLDTFTRRTDFNRRQSAQYAISLQSYINSEEITYDRLEEIEDWLKYNPAVVLQVYDGDYLVFDSVNGTYGEMEYQRESEETAAAWENHFTIDFGGKTVDAALYGNFDYALYNTVLLIEIALSTVLFLFIFFIGIGKRTNYIVKLREEIELLEGGNLDYPITVRGKDELADLAKGLDNMRISFRQQITEAERISEANRTMITQISHDLRTPLTAITLYSEILNNSSGMPEEQQEELRRKIMKKVDHMKDLSDRLLDYYTEIQAPRAAEAKWLSPRDALFDELSELFAFLEQQGFATDADFTWDATEICVSEEYVSRIFNNISSNLLRYADKETAISVSSQSSAAGYCLTFTNGISPVSPEEKGKGIGIHSLESMMTELGGKCETEIRNGRFTLRLIFRHS